MAEKAVSDLKDTSKDLLGKITDMEVFRSEEKVISMLTDSRSLY